MSGERHPPPVGAVLLDAMGTLVDLDAPVPRLQGLLAAAGHHHPRPAIARALATEVAHYRRHHLRGRDRRGLARLRAECAQVLGAALAGDHPPIAELADMLLQSLRFTVFPDVPRALDRLVHDGVRLAVVSNWDISLEDVLAEVGVADHFVAVVTSAQVGRAKPDPLPFRRALAACGVTAAAAIHCGDDPICDIAGPRAVGMRSVLLDRQGVNAHLIVPRITTLADLTVTSVETNLS